MPRVAVEAVVAAPGGDLRVITTHLEYYSRAQRSAQVETLRALYAEGYRHARPEVAAQRDDGGPFQRSTPAGGTIVTGDFNLPAGDPLHARMLAPFDDGTSALADAWNAAHPGVAAAADVLRARVVSARATSPYACDFVFVSPELRARLRDVAVDGATRASDHQPVIVSLD